MLAFFLQRIKRISPSTLTSLREATQNSHSALQVGNKLLARQWARKALLLDSKCEDAWLLMAAVGSPKASVAYLKRVLEINPDSLRARIGMTSAQNRVEAAGKTSETLTGEDKQLFEIPEFIRELSPRPVSEAQRIIIAFKRLQRQIWQLFTFLAHPNQAFEKLNTEKETSWLMPMLALSATLILQLVVVGYFRVLAAASGKIQLPQDWQYWTPDMQNNYMKAADATKGNVINYFFPIIGGLIGLWLGWAVLSALIRFMSTLLGGGGSGSIGLSFKITAWATLPLALRDILRSIFMLFAQHTISSPGLSGFLSGSDISMLYLSQFVGLLDIFTIWQTTLLVFGISKTEDLSAQKSAFRVVIVMLIMLLGQAGLGLLGAKLSGMLFSGI